jgi:methionyl-tRNA synthetase
MDRLYVTTPIYYVNAKPHIGHAYTTVLGDVLARYRRALGGEAYLVTGTDEHGQKVQEAAKRRGMEPLAHCDDMQRHFRELWPTLQIQTNDFIRTTEARHVRVVQEALSRLFARGEIYVREYEGWYSPSVERFWSEAELVDGKCPESGGEVTFLQEKNYWFKMSAYQERLIDHLKSNPDFVVPTNRRNEVLGFLDKPLQDLCISRPKERLSWGIELPFDPGYVTYVWFDALLNYATAAGLYSDDAQFRQWWPGACHLIGKDILTTHCVYWNTMLMALGLPLPKHFVAHGWWLVDNTKMSKSLGNVVDPLSLKDKYGSDVLRYFLMRDMVLGLDATFSEEALVQRNNADLANDLGNLLSRTTKLIAKEPFGGRVPEPGPALEQDLPLLEVLGGLPARVAEHIQQWKVHSAIEETLQAVRRVNKYINDTEPFRLTQSNPARAGHILFNALEGIRVAALCLWPVIPERAAHTLEDIGWLEPPSLANWRFGALQPGAKVSARSALFPRIELVPQNTEVAVTETPPAAAPDSKLAVTPEQTRATIQYDDFAKLELVVVEILEAERVPKSSKLLKLIVDVGTEKRQVVSGIAEHYDPERLVGRSAILLKNLAPRKVFGIESQGMLLAASEGGGLALITPEAYMPPGTTVS